MTKVLTFYDGGGYFYSFLAEVCHGLLKYPLYPPITEI